MLTDYEAQTNIADNVCDLLESRGMSQSELAKMIGENRMSVSRICRAENLPNIGILARIAEALEVTVDELLKKNRRRRVKSA